MLQALVMAEMSSMIPLAGGAFNWVAVLSPASYRKFLSYLTGWLTMISWQVFMADVVYVCSSVLQGLIIITHSEYTPQLWHATLMFYAILGLALFTNVYLGRVLPRIESLCLILYIISFFGIVIPLVYLGKVRTASEVFGTFQNLGGWDSLGLSFFVGWITSTSAFLGRSAKNPGAQKSLSTLVANCLQALMGRIILVRTQNSELNRAMLTTISGGNRQSVVCDTV